MQTAMNDELFPVMQEFWGRTSTWQFWHLSSLQVFWVKVLPPVGDGGLGPGGDGFGGLGPGGLGFGGLGPGGLGPFPTVEVHGSDVIRH